MSIHRAYIARLQGQGRWLVSGSPSTISLTKKFGRKHTKVITVNLERDNAGGYTIAPLDYAFRSTISHWDYTSEEHRWARNKTYIRSLIQTLKKAKIWDKISNKETFLTVNSNNHKAASKSYVKNQLVDLLYTH